MKILGLGRRYMILSGIGASFILYLLYLYLDAHREMALAGYCQENMHLIHQTVEMYAVDYDAHYPLGAHWTTSLQAYTPLLRSDRPKYDKTRIFQCPSLNEGSGYGYNLRLSSRPLSSVLSPATTTLVFETDHTELNYASGDIVLPTHPRHDVNWEVYTDGHTGTSR